MANVTRRVVVSGYTYETDLPVQIGDVVELPTPYWLRDVRDPTWEGTVTSLESDYTGSCVRIIRVVSKKEPEPIVKPKRIRKTKGRTSGQA